MVAVWTSCGGETGRRGIWNYNLAVRLRGVAVNPVWERRLHISVGVQLGNRNHSRYFMWREFNLRNELQSVERLSKSKGRM